MVDSTYHIIGSGVSGLVAAYELAKKGKNVRLYEKLELVGGIARTEIIDGVSYDCGPHLFHTNNPEIKDYWLSLLKDEVTEPDLYGANLIEGKVYEYPISFESLEKQFTKKEIKTIKTEIAAINKEELAESKNYADFVKNLAGEFLSKLFFTKYPEKLWGIPTNQLSAKFAPRRVEIRDKQRAFHSGKGKWAGVLKGGCGALAKAIESKLNNLGVYVEFNKELNLIEMSGKDSKNNTKNISALHFTDHELVDLSPNDVVISTIPITQMSHLLKAENKLWYRNLKIPCILVNKKIELPGSYDWLYIDDADIIFHRITLQNSFSEKGIPKNHSILSLEIACSDGDKIDLTENSKIIHKCINGLEKLKIIEKKDVISTHIIDAKNVYPAIFVGYEEELSKVKAVTDNINNLYMHGALAEYEYSDLQVLTAKSIDLIDILCKKSIGGSNTLIKNKYVKPAKIVELDQNKIGENQPAYIIAEIGLNHNGDLKLAKKMISQAQRAGANAAKLQTYKKGRISPKVRTSRYYEDLVDTQDSLSEMLDNVSFTHEETKELFDYGRFIGLTIFSTPFDLESLTLLESINCPAYKISSMDIVNIPLIKAVAATAKPIIISTGMSDISDIQAATDTVLSSGNKQLILLHCISSYPCPPSSANIKMIQKLANTFETIVGYSDHTTGVDISMAAIALGAKVIEKHFTIDRKMDGPDQNFSILEDELSILTASARRIEGALKDNGYGVLPSELSTAQNLRRSLFFSSDLPVGHVLTEADIEIKSPGIGLHPKFLEITLNQKLKRKVKQDHPLEWEDIIL
jgi:sialic acid synthase SpsE/protoporphyrinogen oxidase